MTRRCAGARWRLLVHDRLERRSPEGYLYGNAHSIGSTPELAGEDREGHHATVIPDTELDEVVISSWFHLEQQGAGWYWMSVAGVVLNVKVDRDGKPVKVTAELEEADGVTYDLDGL